MLYFQFRANSDIHRRPQTFCFVDFNKYLLLHGWRNRGGGPGGHVPPDHLDANSCGRPGGPDIFEIGPLREIMRQIRWLPVSGGGSTWAPWMLGPLEVHFFAKKFLNFIKLGSFRKIVGQIRWVFLFRRGSPWAPERSSPPTPHLWSHFSSPVLL